MSEALGRFQKLVIKANRCSHMSEHMSTTSICQDEPDLIQESLTADRSVFYNSWTQSVVGALMVGWLALSLLVGSSG